ncbi:MAG: SDR family oxidoreductase [Acidimicrobiaceae bacterium]|nr:SDR family oxidoreductase [Acidimicrobiaceae bacterium]
MNIDLSGHRAVITGSGSGISRQVAVVMAESGAEVAVVDINLAAAQATADSINQNGGIAKAFVVDVTSRESIQNLRTEVEAGLGVCDIIINGAGWNIGAPFLTNETEFIDKVIALNLMGNINMCHTFLPALVETGKRGWVVNVSSDAGRVGSLGETVYAAAKGGVIAFSKSLAREMARYNINVNCVAPGPTDTPLLRMQPEKIQEALIRAIPFRRLGDPAEIAHVITFLASEQASYVTGQVISVSGGLTMVG